MNDTPNPTVNAIVLAHGGFKVAGSHAIYVSQPSAGARLIEDAAKGAKATA